MTAATPTETLRELAQREGDGIEVTLYWRPERNDLMVCVSDQRRGAYFVVHPDADVALDAFYHPYSYLSDTDLQYEDARLAA